MRSFQASAPVSEAPEAADSFAFGSHLVEQGVVLLSAFNAWAAPPPSTVSGLGVPFAPVVVNDHSRVGVLGRDESAC